MDRQQKPPGEVMTRAGAQDHILVSEILHHESALAGRRRATKCLVHRRETILEIRSAGESENCALRARA